MATFERFLMSDAQITLLMTSGENQIDLPRSPNARSMKRGEEIVFDENDIVVEAQIKCVGIVAETEEIADNSEPAIGARQGLDAATRIACGKRVQIGAISLVAAIVPQMPLADFRTF